jgi:hypothetical protein
MTEYYRLYNFLKDFSKKKSISHIFGSWEVQYQGADEVLLAGVSHV